MQVCREIGSVPEGWIPPHELRCCSARRRVIEGNEWQHPFIRLRRGGLGTGYNKRLSL